MVHALKREEGVRWVKYEIHKYNKQTYFLVIKVLSCNLYGVKIHCKPNGIEHKVIHFCKTFGCCSGLWVGTVHSIYYSKRYFINLVFHLFSASIPIANGLFFTISILTPISQDLWLNQYKNIKNTQAIDTEDSHYIVWLRNLEQETYFSVWAE